MTDKLQFLDVTRSGLSKLHILLLEVQVWQANTRPFASWERLTIVSRCRRASATGKLEDSTRSTCCSSCVPPTSTYSATKRAPRREGGSATGTGTRTSFVCLLPPRVSRHGVDTELWRCFRWKHSNWIKKMNASTVYGMWLDVHVSEWQLPLQLVISVDGESLAPVIRWKSRTSRASAQLRHWERRHLSVIV